MVPLAHPLAGLVKGRTATPEGKIMKDYLKRLVELAGAGFVAGAAQYVSTSGFHLDGASLRGLGVAAVMTAYGLVVKKLGADQDRPTVK